MKGRMQLIDLIVIYYKMISKVFIQKYLYFDMHTYLDIIGHNLSMEFDNVSCGRGMRNQAHQM